MSGLRILHVIPSVSPKRGGPSTVVKLLGRELDRAGCQVTIATTDDDGPAGRLPSATSKLDDGVDYQVFPRQTSFYTLSRPLRRWLVNHVPEFDVVHVHALFSYPSVVAARIAGKKRVPYVVRPLGTLDSWGLHHRRPLLKRLSLALFERRILEQAAAIHYTSKRESEEAASLGIDTRSVVIPNPVAIEDAADQPTTSERSGKTILFLSRIDQKKGLELLLEASSQLLSGGQRVRLVIAGEGPSDYIDTLQKRAVELGLGRSIEWKGHVPGQDKRRLFETSDVFALPSHSENFGVSAVEAMAAGLPVVVSSDVGVQDVVGDARAGLIVRSDATELAAAIGRILTDGELAQEMGANGRKLAQERFSADRVCQELLSLYRSVARERT